jgi:1,4-dihydroxy-2-naphthoate octaprenyltransferase
VAILPLLLGNLLPLLHGGTFNPAILVWSVLAVLFITISTHFSGEYYDVREDILTEKMEKNAFSGGSQIIAQGILPASSAKIWSNVFIILACLIGAHLFFFYDISLLAIFLGFTGIVAGYFYSKPPFRWVNRGIGEILIGYCYGWLPLAVGSLLQSNRIFHEVHLMSVPIACSVFNIILINEFPDYPADLIAGKKNLVVRFGKKSNSVLYACMHVIGICGFILAARFYLPSFAFYCYLPVGIMALTLALIIISGGFQSRKILEWVCGLTILVNLLSTLVFIGGVVL